MESWADGPRASGSHKCPIMGHHRRKLDESDRMVIARHEKRPKSHQHPSLSLPPSLHSSLYFFISILFYFVSLFAIRLILNSALRRGTVSIKKKNMLTEKDRKERKIDRQIDGILQSYCAMSSADSKSLREMCLRLSVRTFYSTSRTQDTFFYFCFFFPVFFYFIFFYLQLACHNYRQLSILTINLIPDGFDHVFIDQSSFHV